MDTPRCGEERNASDIHLLMFNARIIALAGRKIEIEQGR
jgi:hypothetical protein